MSREEERKENKGYENETTKYGSMGGREETRVRDELGN